MVNDHVYDQNKHTEKTFKTLGKGYPVVFKLQYYNEIKYVLRLTQLSFHFIVSIIGY
jgi:hypothetical protein